MRRSRLALLLCLVVATTGCGGEASEGDGSQGGGRPNGRPAGRGPGGAGGPPGAGGGQAAAVPVEVTPVERRDISSYIETNATLEAENEVDLVARATGPIVELLVEENEFVRRGQLLARLDQQAIRSQLEVSRVERDDAELAFTRIERLYNQNLVSAEEFEQARARLDSARAQFAGNEVQLGYTEIRAPFDGQIVERYIRYAETVSVNDALFRLSDFSPLLAPIQVPERELPRLAAGQRAHLTVEAWPQIRFEARVLRVSPVVEAATGTVRVTLEVDPGGKLRPGMFASVFLQTDTRTDVLVIPRAALALDSLGDTVFLADQDVAQRREVELGYREGDFVEVTSGLAEGERVVSVGQDSLADGTPILVLEDAEDRDSPAGAPDLQARTDGPPSADRLEQAKERMRERGLSEEEIEQRIQQMRERFGERASGESERSTPGTASGSNG